LAGAAHADRFQPRGRPGVAARKTPGACTGRESARLRWWPRRRAPGKGSDRVDFSITREHSNFLSMPHRFAVSAVTNTEPLKAAIGPRLSPIDKPCEQAGCPQGQRMTLIPLHPCPVGHGQARLRSYDDDGAPPRPAESVTPTGQ